MRKVILTSVLSVAAAAAIAEPAWSDYPEKPITFIVTSSPGGTTDVGVRTWAPFLERCLGEDATITVVNKPGAGHLIGLTDVVNAEPDGYTLGSINMPNMTVTSLKHDRYDLDSFDYLGSLYASTATLSARIEGPYESLQQAIDETKQSGEPLQVGIGSIASDDHIMGMRFMRETGIPVTFVPFGAAAATRSALLGEHIDVVSLSMTEMVPFQDQVRILAIGADKRSADAPDVPTFRELGYDVIGGGRHVVGGPKGMPEEATSKLAACLESIATDPEFIAVAKERALILSPLDQQETVDSVRADYEAVKELWETDPWE